MEGANNFENEHKMEIENSFDLNHSNVVKNYLYSRRTLDKNPTRRTECTKRKKMSLPSNMNDLNIDVIKCMNEVLNLLNNLSSKKGQNIFKKSNFMKGDSENAKKQLLENLKQIRKEISKENIPVTKVKNILNSNLQYFIDSLIESINIVSDEYIQLESLWIINNLIFFISKYNEIYNFDVNKVFNSLMNYYGKIQRDESRKYTLIEKIFRIFGNLIHVNNHFSSLLFGIIDSIIGYLNNPVSSFRITCLWLLNKIIIALKKINFQNYIKPFINENAISSYNFIFTRIKKCILFDEISEFYWLICELAKDDSSILIRIFFSNYSTTFSKFKNYNNIVNDYALDNFEFILDNSLTQKMSQISFRLISNLLVVYNNEIKNEYLLTKFIESFFERKSILLFINDILNSPKNKYDTSLVKDVLFLIFNLICISPVKSCIYFKKGVVNLISDRDYQVNREVMNILFMTFYRILISSHFYSFEPNDEKVIRACLSIVKKFKDDQIMLIIFIDILYFYLKASKTNIDSDVENDLQLCRNEQNCGIEKYQNIFVKLANIVKMYSPISKFMRNI